jgi:ribonuclease BN (tRNA processing enzyme)
MTQVGGYQAAPVEPQAVEHGYAGQAATLTAWAMGRGNLRDLINLHEIEDPGSEPFTVLDNGEVTVRAVTVPHLPASYAYRIDSAAGSAVFSGDTGPSDAVASLARGADVLVHEVMDIGAMIAEGFPEELSDVFKSVHTEVSDVGRIAAAAGVPVLVLNHFVPASRIAAPQTWTERISKDYDGHVIVAGDLMSVPVRRPAPPPPSYPDR